MFDDIIAKTLELRAHNEKISFMIAKELALIEINMLWYPDKLSNNLARLKSLSQHIEQSFKNNSLAKSISTDILAKIKSIREK